jgi:hypothetical protein
MLPLTWRLDDLDMTTLTAYSRFMSQHGTAIAEAAKSFEETLKQLQLPQDAPELRDPVALGRRAALRVMAASAWGQVLGPLFDAEQTKTVLGVTSRQAVHDLAKRKRLLVLGSSGGRKLYPAFQFGDQGRPFAEIPELLRTFENVVETPYTIASWFVSPQDLLEGRTPAAWLHERRDSALLLEAAKRSAGELAH